MKSRYLTNINNSVTSIFEGLAVTMSWMFRRPYTVQWPDKIPAPLEKTLPDVFRGILEVETKLCTGCLACQKACPIKVIAIESERDATTKERFMTRFDIDAAKCMYCGLCVEACPTDAIRHTTLFAACTAKVQNLTLSFIPSGERIVPCKPRTEVTGCRPKGEITASLLKGCWK